MAGRVFILGAGASKSDTKHLEISMPLATEFFDESYLQKHWDISNPYQTRIKFKDSALCRVVEQYFAKHGKANKLKIHNVNIEEVYSFIEAYGSVSGSRSDLFDLLSAARQELLKYIIGVVRYVPFPLTKTRLHTLIAKKIKPDDSILSFNWDLLLDTTLKQTIGGRKLLAAQKRLLRGQGADPKDDYSEIAHRQLHEGYLLKLHGSVNLAACVNKSCVRHSSPYWFDELEETPDFWPCDSCGNRIEVLIIPPHAHKSYATSRFFSLQASIAAEKLSIADEIIIIGYSFPAFDLEARAMMRLARLDPDSPTDFETLLKRVVVVNPEADTNSYIEKICDLFGIGGQKPHGHQVKLKTYLSVDEYIRKELSSSR